MIYREKFAVAIRANGKILREFKDVVKLPFGQEFSVLVKNLNSRRAQFTLNIDGSDVLDGTKIIVNANSEVEIKRFIKNGNMDEGNAFKFIERIKEIEDGPRGIKADDGVVRVEFWFEKEKAEIKNITNVYHYYRNYPYHPSVYPYDIFYGSGIIQAGSASGNDMGAIVGQIFNNTETTLSSKNPSLRGIAQNMINPQLNSQTNEINDVGITVPGSKVEQKFTTIYGFDSEINSNVVVLKLEGKTIDDTPIEEPITVKTKKKCVTCGKNNKVKDAFCSTCGTAINLV